jgi:hypothetical protein
MRPLAPPSLAVTFALISLGIPACGGGPAGTGSGGSSGAAGAIGSAGTSGATAGSGGGATAGTSAAAGTGGTATAGTGGVVSTGGSGGNAGTTAAAGSGGGAGRGGTTGGAGASGRGGASGGGGASGRGGASGSGGRAGGGTGGALGGSGGALAACSEMPIRTAPPAGKEAWRYEPIDTRFPFEGHWMGEFSANPIRIGDVSLADFDRDGDLDFASGQRQDTPGGGQMIWWEYCAPDHWVRHVLGMGHTSWAGGAAADFDGDGWMDIIAGNSWYRNPQSPRAATTWSRFLTGGPNPEEIIIGEVTGDARPDALYVHRQINPQYWSPGATATTEWNDTVLTTVAGNRQQQGGAIGDIDGDGDNDILVGYRWWYRNVNGDGSQWQTVEIFASGFDDAPLTALGDLDGDGDTDFVMGTHFGTRAAWAENRNGVGTDFAMHMLVNTGLTFVHTVWAADFDNDRDLDLLIANNVGAMFIYENTDGRGTFVQRRVAADTRGHEARVGDVDCDGDLDIAGTPWGDPGEGGEQSMPPRDHVYLKNLVVERGGMPLFARSKYEALLSTVGVCR